MLCSQSQPNEHELEIPSLAAELTARALGLALVGESLPTFFLGAISGIIAKSGLRTLPGTVAAKRGACSRERVWAPVRVKRTRRRAHGTAPCRDHRREPAVSAHQRMHDGGLAFPPVAHGTGLC